MNLLLSIGTELLAALVFLIPFILIWNKAVLRDRRKCGVYLLFAAYLAAVYNVVGLPNVTYVRFEWNLNLIPFRDMLGDLRSTLLNVVLFLPLGFLLPLCWQDLRQGKRTILYGLGVSAVIEILQIFTFRATDVNDLITNTLGTFLGCCAADLLPGPISGREKAGEAYLVCGITFAVMFFINPLFL